MQKEEETNEPIVLVEGLDLSTKNPNWKVIDRILGCIYGNALGDAYGLATEFESKSDVERNYPDNQMIPFPNYKPTFHSSCWSKGDWTDDTDQMILIMQTILETDGVVDEKLFARKLKSWVRNGFPELGDYGGMGCGATVGSVVHSGDFLMDPHKAAENVWIRMNKNGAANGALMRTSILGCYKYTDINAVIENTLNICKTTHWDSRCTASCIAATVAIALMLQEKYDISSKEGLEKLMLEVTEISLKHLDEQHRDTFLFHLNAKTVEELELDESRAIGYTLKCMGSAFWSLRDGRTFKETLNAVIREAGDADTNGAVCGALVGCKIGYSKLPQDWVKAMPNKKWLDEKVVAFLKLCKLI